MGLARSLMPQGESGSLRVKDPQPRELPSMSPKADGSSLRDWVQEDGT